MRLPQQSEAAGTPSKAAPSSTPAGARPAAAVQAEIDALKQQWPAHSIPPAMLQRLDELEEELEQALRNEAG